jgi:hypothetical protein
MIDPRGVRDADRPAGQADPQREVHVLVVEEELLGKPTEALELRARDREARPGGEAGLGLRGD